MDSKTKSAVPYFLAAVCAQTTTLLKGERVNYSAREGLTAAVLCACAVLLLLVLLNEIYAAALLPEKKSRRGMLWHSFIFVVLCLQEILLVWDMMCLCTRRFEISLAWLAVLILLVLLLKPALAVLYRAGNAVLGLTILIVILVFCGFGGQAHWSLLSLSAVRPQGIAYAAKQLFCFIPEFLAMPLFTQGKRMFRIPLFIFFLQGFAMVGAEMLFGFASDNGRWPGLEMLRAWGIGSFSSIDTLVFGLWLLLSAYRLLLIEQLLIHLGSMPEWNASCGRAPKHEAE